MPFRDDRQSLEDIRDAVDEIEEFVGSASYEEYVGDRKTKMAVERMVLIASEAAHRLGDHGPALIPEHDWSGLRGIGNVIRHAYDGIEDRTVWTAIKVELPTLRSLIVQLLASRPDL